jgi:hypothetical protein
MKRHLLAEECLTIGNRQWSTRVDGPEGEGGWGEGIGCKRDGARRSDGEFKSGGLLLSLMECRWGLRTVNVGMCYGRCQCHR